MKLSIAMTTYNGAKYLQEQLMSFAGQTRLPDELVVCDDASTDASAAILESFAATSPFQVKVVRNGENLGFTKNFEKALSLCSGDLIFLSDQDDVWESKKLAAIETTFTNSPLLNVVINDAIYTDENLVPAALTVMQKVLNFSGQKKDHIAGCSTAITKHFRDFILPFPKKNCPAHDVYIHRWANLLDTKLVVTAVLQSWRIHGENNSESEMAQPDAVSHMELYLRYKNINSSISYLKKANEFREMRHLLTTRKEALLRLLPELNAEKLSLEIDKVIDAHESRAKLTSMNWFHRTMKVISMVTKGQYKYFQGIKSIAKDILK